MTTTIVPAAVEMKRVLTAEERELISTEVSRLTAERATAQATAQSVNKDYPDIPEFLRRQK